MISDLFSKKKTATGKNTAPGRNSIVFPRYRGGEFETLNDAVLSLIENGDIFHLGDIMQYNIGYRDYLRKYGIDKLVELMLHEAPALREEEQAVAEIRKRYERMGGIADYDIQCYDVTKPIPVLGKELPFCTLGGKNVEWFLSESCLGEPEPFHNDSAILNPFGLHLGQLYENYPRFDSSDWSDNRCYQNYIIRTSPIKKEQLVELMEVETHCDSLRVHEHLPKHLLPVLYYMGDGRYALLATAKSQ